MAVQFNVVFQRIFRKNFFFLSERFYICIALNERRAVIRPGMYFLHSLNGSVQPKNDFGCLAYNRVDMARSSRG